LPVPIEGPPSLLAFPVRRSTKITGPAKVNGWMCRIVHETQQHRVGRRRVQCHARLATPRLAISFHINAQVTSTLLVRKDKMLESSSIKPAGFELPFTGKFLPVRTQDATRHLQQATNHNKHDENFAFRRPKIVERIRRSPPQRANGHYWRTQAAGALSQMLRCSRSTVPVFGITLSAFRVSLIACW